MSELPVVLLTYSDSKYWNYLSAILHKEGFQPAWDFGEEDCLQLCRKHFPQVIIMDPRTIGADQVRAVKNIRQISEVPIMVIHGSDNAEQMKCMFDAGADQFLVKPLNTKVLVANLNALIRRYQLSQKFYFMLFWF